MYPQVLRVVVMTCRSTSLRSNFGLTSRNVSLGPLAPYKVRCGEVVVGVAAGVATAKLDAAVKSAGSAKSTTNMLLYMARVDV